MQANDVRLLRVSAACAVAAGAVASLIGGVVAGSEGLVGAVLATAVVLVFFSIGQIAIGRVSRGNPVLMMNMALVTYIAQIGLLVLVLTLVQDIGALDIAVFAFSILGTCFAWIGAQIWVFGKLKIAYVDTDGQR